MAPDEAAGVRDSRVFVGLPAYNEEGALPALLDELQRALGSQVERGLLPARVRRRDGTEVGSFEIVVVDDASTDATPRILAEAAEAGPVFSVRHAQNQNLGGAMRTLFATVATRAEPQDVLVCMDADGTFDPSQVLDLVQRCWAGANLVIASRYVPGGGVVGVPWYRRATSLGANWLFRSLFPIPGVSEYTCSFRAYRVELLQEARRRWGERWIDEDGFTSMPEILLRLSRLPLRTAELPVCIRYDQKAGASKMRVMRNIARTLRLLVVLRSRRAAGPPEGVATTRPDPGA